MQTQSHAGTWARADADTHAKEERTNEKKEREIEREREQIQIFECIDNNNLEKKPKEHKFF